MSDEKIFSIKNYYTRDLPLDEGVESASDASVPLRIRRFTVAQLQQFQQGFDRLINPTAQRFIYRKPDSDEQALRDVPAQVDDKGKVISAAKQEHVIPDGQIKLRRESEMTAEQAAQYDAARQADDVHMVTFCSQAVTDHAWLPKGYRLRVEQDDESVVTIEGGPKSGAGLVEAFGGNLSFLLRIAKAIHGENTLTPEAKKYLRSLSALTASSPQLEGDGKTPAAIATPAAPEATAPSGDALEDPEMNRSGLTPTAS